MIDKKRLPLTDDQRRRLAARFTAALKDRGIRCLRTCLRTPNMNAHIERFMLTIALAAAINTRYAEVITFLNEQIKVLAA